MCLYVYLHMSIQGPQEGSWSPGAPVTGSCEHLSVSAGNRTLVLWTSSKYSEPHGHLFGLRLLWIWKLWVGAMAQWGKVLAKLCLTAWVLSLGPTRWKNWADSCKLSSDLHMYTVTCTPIPFPPHTHIENHHEFKMTIKYMLPSTWAICNLEDLPEPGRDCIMICIWNSHTDGLVPRAAVFSVRCARSRGLWPHWRLSHL